MKFLLSILIICLMSCENTSQQTIDNAPIANISQEDIIVKKDSVLKYIIGNGSLGPLKIGMTINQAENEIVGFDKKEVKSYEFGFDGGSPAYIYSYDKQPIFALLPALGTDSILFIIAINNNLKTLNNLTPKSSSGDIVEYYPSCEVYQNLMNGSECIEDSINNWTFVFNTDNKVSVGEYAELEVPSEIKRKDILCDWIVIQ